MATASDMTMVDRWTSGPQQVLDAVVNGVFSPDEPHRFREPVDELTPNDHFLVHDAFAGAPRRVAKTWHDCTAWWRSSVLNTANVGWFSSDRAIREYAQEICNVVPRS